MQGTQQAKSTDADPNFTSDELIAYERLARKRALPNEIVREYEATRRQSAFKTMLREGYDPLIGVAASEPPKAGASSSVGSGTARRAAKGKGKGKVMEDDDLPYRPKVPGGSRHKYAPRTSESSVVASSKRAATKGGFLGPLLGLLPSLLPMVTQGVSWLINKISGKGRQRKGSALSIPGGLGKKIMKYLKKRYAKGKFAAGVDIPPRGMLTGYGYWKHMAKIVRGELKDAIPKFLDIDKPELIEGLANEATDHVIPQSFVKFVTKRYRDMPSPDESDDEEHVSGSGARDFVYPVLEWSNRKMLKNGGENVPTRKLVDHYQQLMKDDEPISGGSFWDIIKNIASVVIPGLNAVVDVNKQREVEKRKQQQEDEDRAEKTAAQKRRDEREEEERKEKAEERRRKAEREAEQEEERKEERLRKKEREEEREEERREREKRKKEKMKSKTEGEGEGENVRRENEPDALFEIPMTTDVTTAKGVHKGRRRVAPKKPRKGGKKKKPARRPKGASALSPPNQGGYLWT